MEYLVEIIKKELKSISTANKILITLAIVK